MAAVVVTAQTHVAGLGPLQQVTVDDTDPLVQTLLAASMLVRSGGVTPGTPVTLPFRPGQQVAAVLVDVITRDELDAALSGLGGVGGGTVDQVARDQIAALSAQMLRAPTGAAAAGQSLVAAANGVKPATMWATVTSSTAPPAGTYPGTAVFPGTNTYPTTL